ncbi:hypothetical protein BC629DRAFT_720487 [Irpex lacteus]|nr:hypothetical protein BC629DRAFT_720487 [Irpex lacteus]
MLCISYMSLHTICECVLEKEHKAEEARMAAEAERNAAELARQASEQHEAELVGRVQTVEAEANEMREAQAAVAAAAARDQADHVPLVARPRGPFSLADFLENMDILEDEQLVMHGYLRSFIGDLDPSKTFLYQERERVETLRELMCKQFPVLRRFQRTWPADLMMQHALYNRRKSLIKHGVIQGAHRNHKTTHQQRSHQGKQAQVIGLQHRHRRIAHANQVRQAEEDHNIDPELLQQ